MGHGFFVPVVAGYIVWQRREQLVTIPAKPHWSGYLLLIVGFLQLAAGYLGADFFVMRTAFLVSLAGLLLAIWGSAMIKELALPLFLLVFMIRIPQLIYGQVTLPLQLFASRVAEVTLGLLGIPVLREGNILELPQQRLSVVEACSGIRSLLSLMFLSIVYGYFFETKQWVRNILVLLTIPIAVFANAIRVTVTGLISEYDKQLSEGIYHMMEGWIIFLIALGALVASHFLLTKAAALAPLGRSHD